MSMKRMFFAIFGEPPQQGHYEPLREKVKKSLRAARHWNGRAPARDEFAAWRDDPTTRFVFAALAFAEAEQKDAWFEASWAKGEANALLLTELRTRADAYAALLETDYEGFCDWLGVEPENEVEQAA